MQEEAFVYPQLILWGAESQLPALQGDDGSSSILGYFVMNPTAVEMRQ